MIPATGRPLDTPRRVLWVEGKDDSAVVQSLCARHQLPPVFVVKDKAGVDEILRGISVELRAPALECFGIVADANGDPTSRWNAFGDVLRQAGYAALPPRPDAGGTVFPPSGGLPRLGLWIMPDNHSPGMLEDFAGALVPGGDFLWAHARAAIDAIPQEYQRFRQIERSKAHIHTWLAWQEGPGSPMGQAITKGDLDANAPAAQRFVAWLKRLFVD